MDGIVQSIKVSVIVLAYNVEKYIRECMESVVNQTLREIEIICVEDCSTDNTLTILEEYRKRDARIRLICHAENMSVHMGRIDGAAASRGEYVWFVDGDDTIALDGCEKLYALAKEKNTDILHFRTIFQDTMGTKFEKMSLNMEFFNIYDGHLTGREVWEGCFLKDLYYTTIWNKFYRGDFCRGAFQMMAKVYMPYAEDVYEYFVLAYLADSYIGISDTGFYCYRHGCGISTRKRVDGKNFQQHAKAGDAVQAIYNFAKKQGMEEEYKDVLDKVKDRLLSSIVYKWHDVLQKSDQAQGFDMLLKNWNAIDIISKMAKKYWADGWNICKVVRASEAMRDVPSKARVIGVYSYRIGIGGQERVLVDLVKLWTSMGYQCIVFTDITEETEYFLPEGVVRVSADLNGGVGSERWQQRAELWKKVIRQYHVDTMVYHEWRSLFAGWDMLFLRSLGIKVITHTHSIFTRQSNILCGLTNCHMLANAIVTITEMDCQYWNNFNRRTFLVQNPSNHLPKDVKVSNLSGKNVIWVGRVCEVKQPEHAIEIMAQVVREVPDAKLIMVGDSTEADGYMQRLKDLAKERKIEESVVFTGFATDVGQYYQKGALFLNTSIVEGFPLVLLEAKTYGLPCVMYDLPYLMICKGYRGIAPVPMNDISEAARQVIDILQNDARRHEMGRAAKAHADEIAAYDYEGTWRNIFESLEKPLTKELQDSLMWDTLLTSYGIEMQKMNATQKELDTTRQRVKKLDYDIKEMRKSVSYRIGRLLTLLPRKLRGIARCYRQHGAKATLQKCMRKIKEKLRR